MLDHIAKLDGTIHDGCIEEAIPSSLIHFVGMIEHGANIKSQLRFGVSKTNLVIAQLLLYNCCAQYKEQLIDSQQTERLHFQFSWECLCMQRQESERW